MFAMGHSPSNFGPDSSTSGNLLPQKFKIVMAVRQANFDISQQVIGFLGSFDCRLAAQPAPYMRASTRETHNGRWEIWTKYDFFEATLRLHILGTVRYFHLFCKASLSGCSFRELCWRTGALVVPLPWLGAGIQTVRIKRPAVLVPNKLIRYLDLSEWLQFPKLTARCTPYTLETTEELLSGS
jgi:hypothetical protein